MGKRRRSPKLSRCSSGVDWEVVGEVVVGVVGGVVEFGCEGLGRMLPRFDCLVNHQNPSPMSRAVTNSDTINAGASFFWDIDLVVEGG